MPDTVNMIASIVTGLVTITTTVVGLMTLWLKLKYKVAGVEDKIQTNTEITQRAERAADRAVEHTEACDEDRAQVFKLLSEHDTRIVSLEAQMASLKVSVDGVSKSVDSTRHEMRTYMQSLTNKLDLVSIAIMRTVGAASGVGTPATPKDRTT